MDKVLVDRELLPCPFCGGEARLDQRVTQSLWNSSDAVFRTLPVTSAISAAKTSAMTLTAKKLASGGTAAPSQP
ncbi:hypothetical protein PJ263_029855 [Pseudomonas aeruginosa]